MYRVIIKSGNKKALIKDTNLKALKEKLKIITIEQPNWKIGKIQKIKSAEEVFKELLK